MTKFQKKLFSALAIGALVANAFAPAALATTYEISGNGSDSDNDIEVELKSEVKIEQENDADFENDVEVNVSTGNNEAEDNTGGNVVIDTGDAESKVTVRNAANVNQATVNCCPTNGNTEVLISGNGADSDNEVELELESEVKIEQENEADFDNWIDVDAETGDNEAEDNTGGDVTIQTGDVKSNVGVWNAANWNSAVVGGAGEPGTVSLRILGNGADSNNEIDFDVESEVKLEQENEADFENDVEVEAETGNNEAEDNTGGEVMIDTGDADVKVTVDNLANFNYADADCGCPLGNLLAKVSGNGSDSDNEIEVELENEQKFEQENEADFDNDEIDVEAETGNNEAEDNGGSVADDPSIETGDAGANVGLSNEANLNQIGGEVDLPEFPGLPNWSLSLSFSLDDLKELLGLI